MPQRPLGPHYPLPCHDCKGVVFALTHPMLRGLRVMTFKGVVSAHPRPSPNVTPTPKTPHPDQPTTPQITTTPDKEPRPAGSGFGARLYPTRDSINQAVTYRVFLSHSSKDKPFVRDLYTRLTRDGVSCFLDEVSIDWGDNWFQALEQAIDACQDVVLILSPDFVASIWSQIERSSAMADDPAGLQRKLRPLLYKPCDVPRFLKPIQTIDVSTSALFEQNYPRICRTLGGTPPESKPSPTPEDRTQLPPVRDLPTRHRMPFDSLHDKFIGRVADLWALHDSLFRDNTIALRGAGAVAGTGGLGKTQLAIEYAHRFAHHFPGGVYWLDSSRGLTAVIAQLAGSAEIALDPRAADSDQIQQIWAELQRRPLPCLLILDNFPELIPLRPYLPTAGSIHTVITTRRRDLQLPNVDLKFLQPQEAIALLNTGRRQFGPEAAPLAILLGGLPLALELAKSYLNHHQDLSIPALIHRIESAGEITALRAFRDKYLDQLPSGHETDVIQTFQLSWDIAPPAAQQLLRVMAELAPVPVPVKLLRLILDSPELQDFSDPLSDAIAELARLSLVERDATGSPYAHRLILAFVRHRNATDNQSPFEKCVKVLQQQMKRAFDAPGASDLRELESFLPHAEVLLASLRSAFEAANLRNRLGWHHQNLGRYRAAEKQHRAALALLQEQLGVGHPFIARTQSNLALVLQSLGKLEEARDLLRQALASDEKTYAPGHLLIARSQSNLATVLQNLGKLAEARDLLRQALASDEKNYEPGHPSIATRQSNLAAVLRTLGEHSEARDLLYKALASAEQTYAPGHPVISRSQSNLALVLQDLGELGEARDLLRQALASDQRTYAPGHPSIAIRQSNLALVLQDLGELGEARDLLRQALASVSDAPAWPTCDGQIWPTRELILPHSVRELAMAVPAGVKPGDARRAAPVRRNGRRVGHRGAGPTLPPVTSSSSLRAFV